MVGRSGVFEIGTFSATQSKISNSIEPRITGILIRKENSVTSFFSAPQSSPAQIVAPDLEIPGKTASPCATPIISEDFRFKLLSFGEINSTSNKNKAVAIKLTAKKLPEKAFSKKSLKRKTINAVGMVAE